MEYHVTGLAGSLYQQARDEDLRKGWQPHITVEDGIVKAACEAFAWTVGKRVQVFISWCALKDKVRLYVRADARSHWREIPLELFR